MCPRPLDIPPAPSALPYKHFLWSASNIFLHSVLYWLQPVATELLLISLAFVIFELVMGLGRHLGRDRKSGAGSRKRSWPFPRVFHRFCR